MAIAKAERLMNLALCLLGTRRPLSKRELRESIEAYVEAFGPGNGAAGSDESFSRMFERDKDDLRELGLVIETVENLDGEVGYLHRRPPRAPACGAVGAGVLARPLVPGRLGPRPRCRAGVPAVEDHRQGAQPQ